jgi:hypothetical protein
MEPINTEPNSHFRVLFIREDQSSLTKLQKTMVNNVQFDKTTLNPKNIEAIETAKMVCNVLVALFYGNDLYSIGEVKVKN